jgi:hypothetical protein
MCFYADACTKIQFTAISFVLFPISFDGSKQKQPNIKDLRNREICGCKTVYAGSIPAVASNDPPERNPILPLRAAQLRHMAPEREAMTDFYPLVLAALSKLERNTPEARQALYQRARTTLADRLRGLDPPLSAQRIMEERLAFEEAVRKAEADWARGLVEHDLLSKLADTIEHDGSLPDTAHHGGKASVHLSGTFKQGQSGAAFEYTQGAFVFAPLGTEADAAAAADPLVRSIRSELEYKARELAGRISRISDAVRWRSLIDAVRMLAKRLGGSDAEVVADIAALRAVHVALEAYLDSQEATAAPEEEIVEQQIFVPLEADILRLLRDLVAGTGPWLRMFPSCRGFDEQARASGPPPSESIEAAAGFLSAASQAALLGDAEAAALGALLDGAAVSLRERAGSWAIGAAGNLAIAMLQALAGIVSSYERADVAEPSDVAGRIERLLLQHERDLLQVFSYLPDEIREELRVAIDAIRASAADDA